MLVHFLTQEKSNCQMSNNECLLDEELQHRAKIWEALGSENESRRLTRIDLVKDREIELRVVRVPLCSHRKTQFLRIPGLHGAPVERSTAIPRKVTACRPDRH